MGYSHLMNTMFLRQDSGVILLEWLTKNIIQALRPGSNQLSDITLASRDASKAFEGEECNDMTQGSHINVSEM